MQHDSEPSRVIPFLRYNDVESMVDWLVDAFGFERQAFVSEDAVSASPHAQLRFGSGVIMLGPVQQAIEPYRGFVRTPYDLQGISTQTNYLVVEDLDAHYHRARKAGARILKEPSTHEIGSRDYICTDPEGHIWCFGTYWPQVEEPLNGAFED